MVKRGLSGVMLDSLFIFWLNICAACIFAPQFTFISQAYTDMAKSTKTEQEPTGSDSGPVLKPGNIWVHHLKRKIQRQINPNGREGKKIVAAFTKAGFKEGPLPKSAKPEPPVEAETI